MKNSKLLKFAALAFVSATALTAQLAFADADAILRPGAHPASCGALSLNDPSCSAYVKPSPKTAAVAFVRADGDGASCGALSFNDPSCSAYIRH